MVRKIKAANCLVTDKDFHSCYFECMGSRKLLDSRKSLVNCSYVMCDGVTEIKKSCGFILLLVRKYTHSEAPEVMLRNM